jgi:SAM-dependent methyltransferase
LGQYLFAATPAEPELIRLRAIEAYFDPDTRQFLTQTGLTAGWQCLEVGAGAGSIARWLAEQVTPTGQVTAVDLDPRFLAGLADQVLTVKAGDIRSLEVGANAFDLIHARCLLIHLPDWQLALERMVDALKPGGWLVLEEPDFTVSRALAGDTAGCHSFEQVHRAIQDLFRRSGRDPGFGSRLPALLQAQGLEQIEIDNDVAITPGGSAMAEILRLSAQALAVAYLETGKASAVNLDRYDAFTQDPRCWAIYHGLVRGLGRKPQTE